MNRVCPVCEKALKNDDEQVCRQALGKVAWMHYGACSDAWDAQETPPSRAGRRAVPVARRIALT